MKIISIVLLSFMIIMGFYSLVIKNRIKTVGDLLTVAFILLSYIIPYIYIIQN